MKLKTIVRAIALLGVAVPVLAQDAGVSQRVEITGSSIKRIASEGALPVQVISRKDLERQGIVTAEQLIATLSVNGNGLDNLASNADVVSGAARGNNGATAANLRGQGAASTLVLLNGRRMAAHGLNGGVVDLNSIPMGAVERVEILKDGASAIYGTDAVGGVINFILRKNYSGLEAQAFTDITQQGGGNITRFKLTGGFGDLDTNGLNLLAALGYSENQALRGDQRGFVNTFQPNRGLSVDTRGTPYGTVFAAGSAYNALSRDNTKDPKTGNYLGRGVGPTLPGGGTQTYNGINTLNLPGQAGCSSVDGMAAYDAVLWADPSTKYGCAWDTGRAAVIQQPVKNTNLVTRGTLKLGEHQLIAEAVLGRSESTKIFSPNQISTAGSATSVSTFTFANGTKAVNPFNGMAYPSTGADYNRVFNSLVAAFPTIEANRGQGLAFRWRCMPCGPREVATTSDTSRFLLAAEGPLPMLAGWDYRTGLSVSQSESTSTLGGGYQYQKGLADLINSGVLSPFVTPGQSQSAAALAGLEAVSARGVKLYSGKFTVTELDGTVTGPVFKLPAGDVMVAAGVDLRTEKYSFNGDQRSTINEVNSVITGAAFDNINALAGVKRDIKAVFAEVLVPITKRLDLTLAARHDDYTGFGTTDNPKVSLRFTPIDQLVLRGSYSTGFRVPTFNQLFNGVTESPYSGKDLVDPAKCASLKVDLAVAGCEVITPTILTGGKTTLGPENSKQWSTGFVWAPMAELSFGADWWSIRRTGTIQSPILSTLLANYALFPENFLRDSAGNIVSIDNRYVNAGETITKGVDLNASANGKLGLGRWVASLEGSYLIDKRRRLITSSAMGASEVGQFTRADDLSLRWKHNASFTYSQGDWSGTLGQRYSSGYKDAMLPGVANGSVVPADWNPDVKAYTLYNASVGYTGIKSLGLTVGIKNLLNTDPLFSAAYDGNTGAGSSWEPRVADPRGRSFTLTIDYKFF